MNSAAAEIKANVDVRPARSQVFLVATSVVAGIAVMCAAGLLMANQAAGWGFLAFALLLITGSFWAWLKSQSDVDLDEAHPTRIALSDGTAVTTDSRLLRSPEAIKGIARICEEIASRRPLPPPDGLVDAQGGLVPDSRAAAVAVTDQLNSSTQAATNALVDMLHLEDIPALEQVVAADAMCEPTAEAHNDLNMPI